MIKIAKYFDLNYWTKKLVGDVDVKAQFARAVPILKQKFNDFLTECSQSKDKLKDIPGTNYNLGLAHMQRGNIEDAVLRFRMVIFLTPENIGARYYLARCLLLLGEEENAKEQFNLVLKSQADYADTNYQLEKLANPLAIKIIPKAMIKERSDLVADNYDEEFDSQSKSSKILTSSVLANIKDKNPNLEVLDLGCGSGNCGILLKKKEVTKRIVGVDISEKMLKLASRLNIEGNKVYDQLVNKEIKEYLSANDEKFDLIIANLSFEYFGDLSEIVALLKKLLRAHGTVAISIRNDEAVASGYVLNVAYDDFSHSLQYVKDQFTNAGFEELEAKEFELDEEQSATALVFGLK
jgi:predicted TPR repeat methyltransferase